MRASYTQVSPFTTDFTRLNGARFDDAMAFESAGLPSSYDLVVLGAGYSTAVNRGSRPASYSVLYRNHSEATGTKTFQVRTYLSTNNEISTGDLLLQTSTYMVTLPANGSAWATWSGASAPLIPSWIAPGTYYLGSIASLADANPTNNDSSGDDAWPIVVQQ